VYSKFVYVNDKKVSPKFRPDCQILLGRSRLGEKLTNFSIVSFVIKLREPAKILLPPPPLPRPHKQVTCELLKFPSGHAKSRLRIS